MALAEWEKIATSVTRGLNHHKLSIRIVVILLTKVEIREIDDL